MSQDKEFYIYIISGDIMTFKEKPDWILVQI